MRRVELSDGHVEIDFEESNSIVTFQFHGNYDPGFGKGITDVIGQELRAHRTNRCLFDCRLADSTMTPTEIYARPKVATENNMGKGARFAVVVKELNDKTRFVEDTFSNQGFDFRMFESIDEAKQWLSFKMWI